LLIIQERKKRVIDLYFNQHKSYAEIAQIEKISPRDIHAIIKEEEARRLQNKHQQQQEEISAKAYDLFSKEKTSVEVAITLKLREAEVTKLYREYWRLKRLHILNSIYKETNGKLGPILKLYRLMKEKGMSIEQIVNAADIAIHKLPYMESLYSQVKDQVDKMQCTRQGLVNDIEERKNKLSILDKIAFSSEQDCKRTEQQLQELTTQKDILEKFIANILNGEGYSKLKQIVKENVKVVLLERRVLISISFAAIIQTLKADPQMVKLIQNMPAANTGYKDNNNSIAQYLEFNKNSILNLGEKNYENLVEALAKNVIDAVGPSSSKPILSLPSSSTFLDPYNQSDTYRTEESEIYDNSKGDNSE
jgi:hypothetical protein